MIKVKNCSIFEKKSITIIFPLQCSKGEKGMPGLGAGDGTEQDLSEEMISKNKFSLNLIESVI